MSIGVTGRLARAIAILGSACIVACAGVGVDWTGPASLRECTIDGLAEPARCGTVRVAESGATNARPIDLRVIVLPARRSPALPDPVLPLAGGPGQGAADLTVILARRFAFLREERDLVFVDQRGTGASNGLDCEPARTATDLMGRLFDPARLVACRDELSRRADLTQYTTAAAAADYPRVFDALGYRQVNVIGTWYGTRLGLELTRRFPDRIRTLTLDGVVPAASFTWPSSAAADAEAALLALVGDCKADDECARDFPEFQQDIDRAFARLVTQPADVGVRDPSTGSSERVRFGVTDLAYATRGLLYGDEALGLPQWFHDAASGSYDSFAQAYVERARRLDVQIALGVHLGIYCAEDLPFVDWLAATSSATGTRIGTYLIDQYRAACEVWPKGTVPADFREPVRSAVPTLLMSGRRDPVSPPRGASAAARTLSASRVLVWHYGGHATDGLAGRNCRPTIQREFVRSADPGRLPLDCMTQEARLPFRSPVRRD